MDIDASKFVLTSQAATIKAASPAMAIISSEGAVSIDWARVEEEASGSNTTLRAFALALLAVKNKTYIPIR